MCFQAVRSVARRSGLKLQPARQRRLDKHKTEQNQVRISAYAAAKEAVAWECEKE
jgi:hypothetical protein